MSDEVQAPPRADLFKLPNEVLKKIDDFIRNHPRRMGIALEMFEAQHHHTQETLEAWVLKRLEEKFEGVKI
jgi:hypothetical protein